MGNSARENAVRAIPKNVEESRTIPFVVSDTTRDRHKTVLSLNGWVLDAYNRNSIVGYMHSVYGGNLVSNPDPDMIIGKGRVFFEDSRLIGDTTFEPESVNPFAEKIFRKVLFGSLNACSVGFSELEKGAYGVGEEAAGRSNETYYVGKRELLEYSIVNISSNRNTLKRAIRDEPEGVQKYVQMLLGKKMSSSQIKNLEVSEAITLLEAREIDINIKDPAVAARILQEYKFMQRRISTLERQNNYLKKSSGIV